MALSLFTFGPFTFKLAADLRYLITPDAMLVSGSETGPASYGGWSTVFGLNAML